MSPPLGSLIWAELTLWDFAVVGLCAAGVVSILAFYVFPSLETVALAVLLSCALLVCVFVVERKRGAL